MLPRGRENPVKAGIGGIGGNAVTIQHKSDTDCAIGDRPVGYRVTHPGISRVDRLDQPEPAGMSGVNLDGVAGVVAVHAER